MFGIFNSFLGGRPLTGGPAIALLSRGCTVGFVNQVEGTTSS